MELKIIEEKENPLFNRKEFQFEIQLKVTPSKAEVGKSISEKFSVALNTIEIKKIAGKFGSNIFKIRVFIYKTKEDRMSTESKPRIITEKKVDEPKEAKETEKKEVEKPKEEKAKTELKEDSKEGSVKDKSE